MNQNLTKADNIPNKARPYIVVRERGVVPILVIYYVVAGIERKNKIHENNFSRGKLFQ